MRQYRLGCAESYTAEIRFQGGGDLLTKIAGMTELSWARKRDDWSEAGVSIAKTRAGADCCGRLAQTHTWAHELRVMREGHTDPVWEGPITRVKETRAAIELDARDMLFWADRRELSPAGAEYYYHQPADTGVIIRRLFTDGFPPDEIHDPGLMPYAVLRNSGTRSTTDRLWKNSTTIGEVLRDLIGAGVDLYAVGRRIYAIPERTTATPYRLTEADFLDELEVIENGVDACTRAIVVGGQPLDNQDPPQPIQNVPPVIGVATAPNTDPDRALDYYGLVTRVSTSPNLNNPDVANELAAAILSSGYPPPIDLIVPDNARLSPGAPVDINQLIPGRPFVVLLNESYCRRIQQEFRLNELEVTWESSGGNAGVEEVAVSLTSTGPVQGVPQVGGAQQ